MLVRVSLDILEEGDIIYYHCGSDYRRGIYTSKASQGVNGIVCRSDKFVKYDCKGQNEFFANIKDLDGVYMELDYYRDKLISIILYE